MRCEWAHSRRLCLGIPTRAVPMAKRQSVGVYGFTTDMELSTHVMTLLLAALATLFLDEIILGFGGKRTHWPIESWLVHVQVAISTLRQRHKSCDYDHVNPRELGRERVSPHRCHRITPALTPVAHSHTGNETDPSMTSCLLLEYTPTSGPFPSQPDQR